MFARYGIVDRADMAEALMRREQWEREQHWEKQQFEHSLSIGSTKSGAINESRPGKDLN